MTTPEERVAILKAEYQRLEHYLHTLSRDAWNHPSTSDQWTVAEVVAHITDGNRNYATCVTDALQSQIVQPERLPRRSNERVDAQAAAHRVIALRKELGDQLLSEFIASSRAMEHALAQVGPDDWET